MISHKTRNAICVIFLYTVQSLRITSYTITTDNTDLS